MGIKLGYNERELFESKLFIKYRTLIKLGINLRRKQYHTHLRRFIYIYTLKINTTLNSISFFLLLVSQVEISDRISRFHLVKLSVNLKASSTSVSPLRIINWRKIKGGAKIERSRSRVETATGCIFVSTGEGGGIATDRAQKT